MQEIFKKNPPYLKCVHGSCLMQRSDTLVVSGTCRPEDTYLVCREGNLQNDNQNPKLHRCFYVTPNKADLQTKLSRFLGEFLQTPRERENVLLFNTHLTIQNMLV